MAIPNEKLLEKFLDNNCTRNEAKIVLEWIASREGQSFLEKQFDKEISLVGPSDQKINDQEVRSTYMYQQILQKINAKENVAIPFTRRITRAWLKIAAAILIPLLITNIIVWVIPENAKSKPEWQEVYVPKGEKLQVMFQDGTKVWLNSDTRLKYPVEFANNERQVKLEGEAYFVVKKNPEKPFIVQLDQMTVKVTGTSFNVKAYQNEQNITTSLDEGRIYIQTREDNQKKAYLLRPGQQASYSKANTKVSIKPYIIGQNSLWKDNELLFRDTPLPEVIKVLERWYNVKFEIPDKDILKYTYTIRFKNEPIKNVLAGLEKITPLQFNYMNGIIKVTKKLNYK